MTSLIPKAFGASVAMCLAVSAGPIPAQCAPWIRVSQSGACPAAFSGHGFVFVPGVGLVTLAAEFPSGANWSGYVLDAATGSWTTLTLPQGLTVRRDYGLAYDSVRNRVVVYGGDWSGTVYADLFEWDCNVQNPGWWNPPSPGIGGPQGRTATPLCYHAGLGEAILFSGADSSGVPQSGAWGWNGTSWRQISDPGEPAPRNGIGMTVDPATGDVVVFAGYRQNSSPNDDLYVWRPGVGWTPVPRVAPWPSSREAGDLLPDPFSSSAGPTVIRLVGGADGSGLAVPDSEWLLDLSTRTWRPLCSTLPPRFASAIAFDPVRGRIACHGGQAPSRGTHLGDLWTLPAQCAPWIRVSQSGACPAAFSGHGFVFVPGVGLVTLAAEFPSGANWSGYVLDAATGSWTTLTLPPGLTVRRDYGLAYDSARNRVVVYGGDWTGMVYADLFEWDCNVQNPGWWSPPSPGTGGPGQRTATPLCYHAGLREAILFSGAGSGGVPQSGAWGWNGTNWRQISDPGEPAPRNGIGMTVDPATGDVVVFAGYRQNSSPNDDLHVWRPGVGWTPVPRVAPWPSSREAGDLLPDPFSSSPATTVIRLVGGADGSGLAVPDSEWLLDLSTRTWRPLCSTLPPRFASAIAFDPVRGRIACHGGQAPSRGTHLGDLWTLSGALGSYRTFGSGCAGSCGVTVLAPAPGQVPQIGRTVRTQVTSLPAPLGPFANAVGVLGLSDRTWGPIPLPTPLTVLGRPNCFLLVSVDHVQGLTTFPSGNCHSANWDLLIPANPALIGLDIYQQVIMPDFPANSWVVSNALHGIIG